MIGTYQNFFIIIFCLYCFNAYGFGTEKEIRGLARILSEKICKIEVKDVDNLTAKLSSTFPHIKLNMLKKDNRVILLSFQHTKELMTKIRIRRNKTVIRLIEIEIFTGSPFGLRPRFIIRQDALCQIRAARGLEYKDKQARVLYHVDNRLKREILREKLNPPVPYWENFNGIKVVHIDSGVNYLLEGIYKRLARDRMGNLLGWDYWDKDSRPFDINTSQSPFFPLRHGTAVASVLLREASNVSLVPFRYPHNQMSDFSSIIDKAMDLKSVIAMLPMGSQEVRHWEAFKKKAQENQQILFIISAGNNGWDIDKKPVYPASFDLKNFIVVTSSDDFGRLAVGSNWGRNSVDIMVPSERITVTDHRGVVQKASGSSYAVPRVAALAARLKGKNPNWTAIELKKRIFELAVPSRIRGQKSVRIGWIPNPLDDY